MLCSISAVGAGRFAAHLIRLDERNTATALKLFDRALELSNSNVFALSLSAIALAGLGQAELAIERAERAIRLSPFDAFNFRSHSALAIAYFCRGKHSDSVEAAQSAVRYNRNFSISRAVVAAALLRAGRSAEAHSSARDVLECERTFTIRGLALTAELEPAVFGRLAQAWQELRLPD
jgi:adenylate cyclase